MKNENRNIIYQQEIIIINIKYILNYIKYQ
jgi:hypothetical protein